MTRTENECVDCGLPCIGDACPHRHVERKYCDYCGDYADLMYEGEDLCLDCFTKLYVNT